LQEETGLRPVLYSWPCDPEYAVPPAVVSEFALEEELETVWHAYRARQLERLAAPEDPGIWPDDVEPWEHDPGPPFDHWPGLAPAGSTANTTDRDTAARSALGVLMADRFAPQPSHLALVPAARGRLGNPLRCRAMTGLANRQ
jgi:hypothetical protein